MIISSVASCELRSPFLIHFKCPSYPRLPTKLRNFFLEKKNIQLENKKFSQIQLFYINLVKKKVWYTKKKTILSIVMLHCLGGENLNSIVRATNGFFPY
jgi:hypothetical protein